MMPVEFDVTGKVVFITGAGRGIGKGIAQVLAESGDDIALNAVTPKYVEGTAAEIAAASGRLWSPSSPTSRRRTRSGARLIRSLPPLGISTCW